MKRVLTILGCLFILLLTLSQLLGHDMIDQDTQESLISMKSMADGWMKK